MKVNSEIEAAIKATITDATLQASLIASLTATKTVARTAEEEQQYKDNLIAASKDDIVKEEKKVIMRRIEDDVKELTGLKQNPSEPYHEFMKRGFLEFKTKLDTVTAEKEAIAKGGTNDGVYKTKYDTLEQQSKAALAEKDKEMEALKKSVATNERRIEVDKILGPLSAKFAPDLPSFFAEYKESVIAETLAKSALIDGKLVLVDENGNPRKDGNLNNITVESHLAVKFKDVIKEDKTQAGGGTKAGAEGAKTTTQTGGKISPSSVPEDVNTEGKLTEYLGKQGLLQGTKEFDENYNAIKAEKKITKLF